MTSAREVIETYIADVAEALPLRQRADIACELYALLDDGLRERSERAGRPADETMARALVADFGNPRDVAMRYRPAGFTIIAPEHTGSFVQAAAAGVLLQWAIGIVVAVARLKAGDPAATVLQQWFFSWGIGAFWWPGLMVASAAAAAWLRERAHQSVVGGTSMSSSRKLSRMAAGIGLPLAALFTVFYMAPGWFVGHIAPAGFDPIGFTYTDEFRVLRLPALLAYMTGNVILLATIALKGQESRLTRRVGIATGIAGVAVMTWCAFGGPMFMLDGVDKLVRLILAVIVFFTLIDLAQRVARELVLSRPDRPSAT